MKDLLKNLNIEYKNIELYTTALIHPSYMHEHKNVEENNQRLEFLGDAIFDMIISEYLFNNRELSEGEMTKNRALYVREKALSIYARSIKLDQYLLVGRGENVSKDAIVADAFESFLAAIYLDLGLEGTLKFFEEHIRTFIESDEFENDDYKTKLQELLQCNSRPVAYVVSKQEGPSHCPTFFVDVYVDEILFGSGSGSSKKNAEQSAAKCALKKMAK